MNLADQAVVYCKMREISLATLEKETGLGKGTIYRWNDVLPSIDKVIRVADYFNVSLDAFLGRKPESPGSPDGPGHLALMQLTRQAAELPPDDVMLLFTLAKRFAEKKEGRSL